MKLPDPLGRSTQLLNWALCCRIASKLSLLSAAVLPVFENEEPDEPDEAEPAEPELAAEAEDRPEVFIGERTSRFGVLREKRRGGPMQESSVSRVSTWALDRVDSAWYGCRFVFCVLGALGVRSLTSRPGPGS